MTNLITIEKTKSNRTFGIEIEMYSRTSANTVASLISQAGVPCNSQSYNHHTSRAWKIVSDGSLNNAPRDHIYAMEIVSPILRGEEGLRQIRVICAVINDSAVDAQVNKTCGLHVHHGAGDFGRQQFKNLFNLYKKYEDELDELVAPSRRGDNAYYCRGLQNKNLNDLYCSRYNKLNLCSFERHGTVEIRHFNGTTDAAKICGWVVLTQAIVDRAVELKAIRSGRCAQFNLFRAVGLYKWNAEDRATTEEEKNEFKAQYTSIRKWVTSRKRQLASA